MCDGYEEKHQSGYEKSKKKEKEETILNEMKLYLIKLMKRS
jgi:hypothetical protein